MTNEIYNGIKLIVGLGNPSSQYEETRHNVGMWFANAIAQKYSVNFSFEAKFYGFYSTFTTNGFDCKLLMPSTFMNCSGKAVQAMVNFYKIPVESILLAHDELDFSPGVVRLKFGGGHNGHKGVQNTMLLLGSDKFYRLRIGIGRCKNQTDTSQYVLGKPARDEKNDINCAIQKALVIIPELVEGQTQKAMNLLHTS